MHPESIRVSGVRLYLASVRLPGFPPSYVFFRNGLVSDGLYSMVFVAGVYLTRSREERTLSPLPIRAGLDAALADARSPR